MTTIKTKILGAICALTILTPFTAQAVPITVQWTGTIDNSIISNVAVGDTFSVSASFDTDRAVASIDTGGIYDPGARYRYDTSGIVMSAQIGSLSEITVLTTPGFNSHLYVRDDSGDLAAFGQAPGPVDGLNMGVSDADFSLSVGGRMGIDDLFDGGSLDGLFDARFMDQLELYFHINDYTNSTYARGTLQTMSLSIATVAEPGTLALVGLGLACFGFARRRRLN